MEPVNVDENLALANALQEVNTQAQRLAEMKKRVVEATPKHLPEPVSRLFYAYCAQLSEAAKVLENVEMQVHAEKARKGSVVRKIMAQ